MFRYPADRLPVFIILMVTAVDFYLFFSTNNIWVLAIYWLVMIVPKGKICAWNHHHQHTPTFRKKSLNRFLEFFYALHSGVTTNLWVLHHVLGHHHHFLDQTKDESRWKRRSGEKMGEFEYTFNVAITAYYRGYLVGKRHPKIQKDFILFGLLTLGAVIGLTIISPIASLFLFILPMVMGLLLTSWATYGHHAGLDTKDEFCGSYNNLHPFYNFTTGNLGYHTAHHYKQGMHWSKLPQLHESIKDKIPPELIKRAAF